MDFFSPEIMEMIFNHLDNRSLKSCLMVSKYCRESILNSPKLMRKLPLKLNSENWLSKVEMVKKIGSKIKQVEIVSRIPNCEFIKLLHYTPMVSKVEINWSSVNRIVESFECEVLMESMEIKLELLENLKISFFKVNPEIFFNQLLNSMNVQKLCIRCNATSERQNECISMIKFLKRQSRLEELELNFGNFDEIFSEATIEQFHFKLKKFTIVPSYYTASNFEHLNTFLLTQSNSLEELYVFSEQFEEIVANSIYRFRNLKRLSTHTLLSCFEFGCSNSTEMTSLTHYRYYGGNTNACLQHINPASIPNLQSLNVHFGIDHRLSCAYPDEEAKINPLRKLQKLREFHIESRNQNVLHYLASPELKVLATSCEDELREHGNWIKMSNNLPQLQTLIIENLTVDYFKFICSNFKKFIRTLVNLQLLILREHFDNKTVLKFFIQNGKLSKVRAYYCNNGSMLIKRLIQRRKKYKRKFGDFRLISIDDDEYESNFEFWNCYFYICGP